MPSETLALLKALIRCPSITPNDYGCQSLISERLHKIGFKITSLPYQEVDNLWACYGQGNPLFVFAGHTDVVPEGPLEAWQHPPFTPTIVDNVLYGRGAADMKSGIAAMITAVERFLKNNTSFKGRIAFLLTSDEEGPALHGTRHVLKWLQNQNISIDYCIVGEASSEQQVGDTIKYGHRGSMTGHLTVFGKQGHVAQPDVAKNAIHLAMPIFSTLIHEVWDNGNTDFEPTSFQISNLHAGNGAGNVIPGILDCLFNFRFNTETTVEALQKRIQQILDLSLLEYHLTWQVFGLPFISPFGKLTSVCQEVIKDITGSVAQLATTGGTSDARFIVPTGAETIELGPVNATIHQVDECIDIQELEILSQLYEGILKKLF